MGIYGVALLMAIENVVLPLPSEVIMTLGGFAASRGRMRRRCRESGCGNSSPKARTAT